MKKKWIPNLILVIVSTVITLIVVELFMRFMLFSGNEAFEPLRDPSAYAKPVDNKYEDFYDEGYWKMVFMFRNKNNLENPHPLLGWAGSFNPDTYLHSDAGKLNGRRPVLLFGDSFAQCVDTVFCFQDYLNTDTSFSSGHYFLNYGVGGYGVDQISLLFEEVYDEYEDPFIIFSLLTTDMDRSMLKFRDYQKPYFTIKEDKLELKAVPIELSTEEYIEENPPDVTSYLYRRFRNSKIYPFKKENTRRKEKFVENTKQLNGMILKKVHKQLKNSGLDYVFLIFHPVHHGGDDWRINYLREFCKEQDMPCIFDADIREKDINGQEYSQFKYAIKNDGHPTSYTNKLISDSLKNYILSLEE